MEGHNVIGGGWGGEGRAHGDRGAGLYVKGAGGQMVVVGHIAVVGGMMDSM